MEVFARNPTSPTQTQTLTATEPPPLDAPLERTPQSYPSPIHERAPLGALGRISTAMAAMSPVGTGPMPVGQLSGSVSPRTVTAPKVVEFILLLQESPYRARLPLRVSIYPHDTTDSIITTVAMFYGLYSGSGISKGISFEDQDGNTLIARYENFHNNMRVHVRVIEEPLGPGYHAARGGNQGYYNDGSYLPHGPQQQPHNLAPRPTSRTSRLRSASPNRGRDRRSMSAGTNPTGSKKGRSRSSKNRSQVNGEGLGDSFNGYSSGDGGAGSSSGRAKEQLGNTDISLENIVEGGRRKRAKFESSELPLFAPPQMPAATSNPSVSPARRVDPYRNPLPLVQTGQNPFSHPHPIPSPRTHMNGYPQSGMYATPGTDTRRSRGSFGFPPGQGMGPGLMMTPDPTVGSAVSEEDKDVAMQLMRMSTHGRTSASTQDDTLSGRASSMGAVSDAESGSDNDVPAARRQKLDASGAHKKVSDIAESQFAFPKANVSGGPEDAESSDGTEHDTMPAPPANGHKLKANTLVLHKLQPPPAPKVKSSRPAKPKAKAASVVGPMTPASLPGSRKQSIASNPTLPSGPGEEEQPDLSTQPRCQRCRKSKKGCDRQRPCGRCRDAGIPAELCISEDEGNGRKGRYGRHMGVPIMAPPATNPSPPAPIAPLAPALADPSPLVLDKVKKRKR